MSLNLYEALQKTVKPFTFSQSQVEGATFLDFRSSFGAGYSYDTGNTRASISSINFTGYQYNTGSIGYLSSPTGLEAAVTTTVSGLISSAGNQQGLQIASGANIVLTGLSTGLNLEESTIIIGVDFIDNFFESSLLFEGLQTGSLSLGASSVKYTRGFNFGLTDRGQVFIQAAEQNGDSLDVATSIELNKNSVFAVRCDRNQFDVVNVDFPNDRVESQSLSFESIGFNGVTGINLGKGFAGKDGTGYMMRGVSIFPSLLSDQDILNFSKAYAPYSITSGVITGEVTSGVTGFTDTVTYKQGVTGYLTTATSTSSVNNIFTYKSLSQSSSTGNILDGSHYFKGFTTSHGSDFYIKKVGFLSPSYEYSYSPTGNSAEATKGILAETGSVINYNGSEFHFGTSGENRVSYALTPLTGDTEEIDSITQTPVYEVTTGASIPFATVELTGSPQNYCKNYLYYIQKLT